MSLIKFLLKCVVGLYCCAVFSLVLLFSFAEQCKPLIHSILENVFDNPVSLGTIHTVWNGATPEMVISNIAIHDSARDEPVIYIKKIAGKLHLRSFFQLKPVFKEVAIVQPKLTVDSANSGNIKVAGIALKTNKTARSNPQKLIARFLGDTHYTVYDGQVHWLRQGGATQLYKKIAFIYSKQAHNRSIRASFSTEKGTISLHALVQGDLIHASDWDAEFDIQGVKETQRLSTADFQIKVESGTGQMQLKQVTAQGLRDFMRLVGMVGKNSFLYQAQLKGQLHDVQFKFHGPLLNFKKWSLKAGAYDLGFSPLGEIPEIHGLNGNLSMGPKKGSLIFWAEDTSVFLPQYYAKKWHIESAKGKFKWEVSDTGEIQIQLVDGELKDGNATLSKMNVVAELQIDTRKIRNFADFFQLDSLQALSYQDGDVIIDKKEKYKTIFVNARTEFNATSVHALHKYIPVSRNQNSLIQWWQKAFLSGEVQNGVIQYVGALSKDAIEKGKARVVGQADFDKVSLDYGYQRAWPKIYNGKGTLFINNDALIIKPEHGKFGEDKLQQLQVRIQPLFRPNRNILIQARIKQKLKTVADFLYGGPLSAKSSSSSFPLATPSGKVNTQINVVIPLKKVQHAKVTGTSKIENGELILPSGIVISNLNTAVSFTQNSVSADTVNGTILGNPFQGKLFTVKEAQPPVLQLDATGIANAQELVPWSGPVIASLLDGQAAWQGAVTLDNSDISIQVKSDLLGMEIDTVAPLHKSADTPKNFQASVDIGPKKDTKLDIVLDDTLFAKFDFSADDEENLFKRSMISLGEDLPSKPGVNISVTAKELDLDAWLKQIIAFTDIPTSENADSDFLDGMRSITIRAQNTEMLGRAMSDVFISAMSVDGHLWIGSIDGENIKGTFRAEPRAQAAWYDFNLDSLHLVEDRGASAEAEKVDISLLPKSYPEFSLKVNSFYVEEKFLGALGLHGKAENDIWELDRINLTHPSFNITGTGRWQNSKETGTITQIAMQGEISEASQVLDDMQMDGYLKQGKGELTLNVNWIGAPHEFDYSRLNGDFDFKLKNGELTQIEPGSGKLIGLLNSNVILKRLAFDFRDVFSKGLQFNRLRFEGLFADGEAIMRDAYIFSPAVFIRAEGKVDLNHETIDMELFVSPELGGNVALLSALANPAAGAVVFITQKIFKNQLRASNYKRYRVKGDWQTCELEEFDEGEEPEMDDVE